MPAPRGVRLIPRSRPKVPETWAGQPCLGASDGAPAYDHGNAAALASLGCPVFAGTPEQFPPLMAAAIEGRDINLWAAGQGIAGARPGWTGGSPL
jgi:hypothetical protein